MTSHAADCFVPLHENPVQPYFTSTLQLADILAWIVSQTGIADVDVSTFSTSEGFIRRVVKLRESGAVRHCRMLCDMRASCKTATLMPFISSAFDDARLSRNHSKVILVHGELMDVAVVTSQNQTRGDRLEAGMITADADTFRLLDQAFVSAFDNALPVNGIFT